MDKDDKPCDHYFGNVCTGFGGTTDCYVCGWDMYDHEPYKSELERIFDENT